MYVCIEHKCPRCDRTFVSYQGMRRHAGMAHHLVREKGVWKEVHGQQARDLVAKLQAQSSHHSSMSTPVSGGCSYRFPTFPPPLITTESVPTLSLPVPPVETVPPSSAADSSDTAVTLASTLPAVSLLPPASFSVSAVVPPSVPSPGSFSHALPSASPNLFTPPEFDPFLSCTGVPSEAEDLQPTTVSQPVAACVIYSKTPQTFPAAVEDTAQQQDCEEIGSTSSESSHNSRPEKRSRMRPTPVPIPLSPPTREELVEWVFSHPEAHPSTLASAALAGRGLTSAYDASLAQQFDDVRRTMVHYARLLLLAHNHARQASEGSPPSIEDSLYAMAMRGIAPPPPKK